MKGCIQATEPKRVLRVYADGGTINGSPGEAIYWSVGWDGERKFHVEDEQSGRTWHDEAEYQALRAALRKVRPRLEPGDQVVIYVDYIQIVSWVRHNQQPSPERLHSLHESVLDLIDYTEREYDVDVRVRWVQRGKMVEVLGH